jgi:hypothetical protein
MRQKSSPLHIAAARTPRRRRVHVLLAVIACIAVSVSSEIAVSVSSVMTPAALAAPKKPSAKQVVDLKSDARELSPVQKYSTNKLKLRSPAVSTSRGKRAEPTPPVGTTRTLLALDDFNGRLYLKPYTLKAVGAHIEVWVAVDTSFPTGDCRSAVAGTTTVTVGQAAELAAQFDHNMFPKESEAFSVAHGRRQQDPDPGRQRAR